MLDSLTLFRGLKDVALRYLECMILIPCDIRDISEALVRKMRTLLICEQRILRQPKDHRLYNLQQMNENHFRI